MGIYTFTPRPALGSNVYNVKVVRPLTKDQHFKSGKTYYKKDFLGNYVTTVAGTDYVVGDLVPHDTFFEDSITWYDDRRIDLINNERNLLPDYMEKLMLALVGRKFMRNCMYIKTKDATFIRNKTYYKKIGDLYVKANCIPGNLTSSDWYELYSYEYEREGGFPTNTLPRGVNGIAQHVAFDTRWDDGPGTCMSLPPMQNCNLPDCNKIFATAGLLRRITYAMGYKGNATTPVMTNLMNLVTYTLAGTIQEIPAIHLIDSISSVLDSVIPNDNTLLRMFSDHCVEYNKSVPYNTLGFQYDPSLSYADTTFNALSETLCVNDVLGYVKEIATGTQHQFFVYNGTEWVDIHKVVNVYNVAKMWSLCDYFGSMQILAKLNALLTSTTVVGSETVLWWNLLPDSSKSEYTSSTLCTKYTGLVSELLSIADHCADLMIDIAKKVDLWSTSSMESCWPPVEV